MVKHAVFYKFQLYNSTLRRMIIDAPSISPGQRWTAPITGEPDSIQWRLWWINDGDEPITSRVHWVFREKLYGKAWSGWYHKIEDVTMPLNPGVDAGLFVNDVMPMKIYEPTGQMVYQYVEEIIELYADDTLTDKLRIFIDNDDLVITVTNERPAPPPPAKPDLKIERLDYPSSARPGEAVTISWDVCNYGGDGEYPEWMWTRLIDLDTGAELYKGIGKMATGVCSVERQTFTMPDRDWRLRVEAGYGDTITDSREFTIALVAPPAPIPLFWTVPASIFLGGVALGFSEAIR